MTIDDWRRQIDEIDAQLVQLLNRRSDCAIEIGKLKHKLNLNIFFPEREKEVISKALKVNRGSLDEVAIRRIFSAIFEELRRLEALAVRDESKSGS